MSEFFEFEEGGEDITEELDEYVDAAGNSVGISTKPADKAEEEVKKFAEEEINRRRWCVNMALSSWNVEANEHTFVRIADKIYEYIYGKHPL